MGNGPDFNNIETHFTLVVRQANKEAVPERNQSLALDYNVTLFGST